MKVNYQIPAWLKNWQSQRLQTPLYAITDQQLEAWRQEAIRANLANDAIYKQLRGAYETMRNAATPRTRTKMAPPPAPANLLRKWESLQNAVQTARKEKEKREARKAAANERKRQAREHHRQLESDRKAKQTQANERRRATRMAKKAIAYFGQYEQDTDWCADPYPESER